MKKLIVLAFALTFAGVVSMAQEPVKKTKEPQKTEHKCCKDKKDANHKCTGEHKDANHKCTGQCKSKTTGEHKCSGKKDANHKCTGQCKHHQKDVKAEKISKEVKK